MSALLQSYEEEHSETSAAIKRDMDQLRNSLQASNTLSSTDRAALLKGVQTKLTKLKELNTNIEYEAAQRADAKQKVADYKRAVFTLEKDLTRMKTDVAQKDREDLLVGANSSSSNDGLMTAESDVEKARQQMARNTEKLKKGSDVLRNAEQLVNETDALADDTIDNLAKQRDQIKDIKRKAMDTDDELNHARRTLTRMQKVMIQNKAILIVIIIVLVSMIIGLAYVKAGGSSSNNGVKNQETTRTNAPSGTPSPWTVTGADPVSPDAFTPAPTSTTNRQSRRYKA
jgi:chromosome segregation ATPase